MNKKINLIGFFCDPIAGAVIGNLFGFVVLFIAWLQFVSKSTSVDSTENKYEEKVRKRMADELLSFISMTRCLLVSLRC